MSSFIPHETFATSVPDYEGIPMDAFFFVPAVVGLPAKPAVLAEEDESLGFSVSELITI
jgi:hypothetical protein